MSRVKTWYHNLRQRPWAFVIGFLVLSGGIAGLLGAGAAGSAVAALIPQWLSAFVNGSYALGGLTLLVAFATERANVEAGGTILMVSGTLIRTVAIFTLVATRPEVPLFHHELISTYLLYIAFYTACFWRLSQISHDERIVRLKANEIVVSLDPAGDAEDDA